MSKQDQKDDELVTRTAAMVLHGLKPALKAAIKDIYWELWRELFEYLIKARWFRVTTGGITLIGMVWVWVKDHAK